MPLWSRRRDDRVTAGDPAVPAVPADVADPNRPAVAEARAPLPVVGELPCSRAGCQATNAATCRYVDRRGRRCATAWCPDHQLVVQGRPYCTRHGGVVRAVIAGGATSAPLPDIDNRAPSLVQFVGEAVSEGMGAAIREAWPGDLHLGVFAVNLSYLGPQRRRSWSRKWTRYSHRGDEVAVTLAVAEDRDDAVIVRVDTDTVAELVPPWISHRSTAGDELARQSFFTAIVDAARVGVAKAHAREAELRELESQSWVSRDEGS